MRLDACTSISSILYEFSSSLILCASAGVNLLHVAGSLRRSYTDDGNVSYTDKFDANARRFAGAVCDLCVSVGGFELNIVESAGADEFGWLKSPRSGVTERMIEPVSTASLAASTVRPLSKLSGGRKVVGEVGPAECGGCLWRPSMWSGSGEGMRASGPSSGPCDGGESYEFERCRKGGFGATKESWS